MLTNTVFYKHCHGLCQAATIVMVLWLLPELISNLLFGGNPVRRRLLRLCVDSPAAARTVVDFIFVVRNVFCQFS